MSKIPCVQKHIVINDVKYVAHVNDEGEVVQISIRTIYNKGGPLECWYNKMYWHRSHKLSKNRKATVLLIKEIVANMENTDDHIVQF